MRVLCISPLFAPLADSEAICSGKVVNGLLARGIDTDIISFQELDAMPPERRDRSRMWDGLLPRTVRLPSNQPRKIIQSSVYGVRYRTVSYARSVSHAVDAATAMHDDRPFDVVYSRSLPMISHVIGFWVSRKLGLRWIANINDPWDIHLAQGLSSANMSAIEARVSTYWLRKTLTTADVVTYPSRRLWKYHERCSGIEHEAEVIAHIGLARAGNRDDRRITLVHAGKIGKNELPMRSPAGFFQAVRGSLDRSPQMRSKLRLVFVGPEDEYTLQMARDLGLHTNLRFAGRLDYEDSLREISAADACVLIEAKYEEGIYLPSKLADYISARKPVIALSPRAGILSDLSSYNGIFRADPDAVDEIGALVDSVAATIANGQASSIAPSDELVRSFDQDLLTDKLMACMTRNTTFRRQAVA